MKSRKRLESLRRFCGKGTHLYQDGQLCLGWLIVPVRWGRNGYTVSYFSPSGVRHIGWESYATIPAALAAGHQLVQARVSAFTEAAVPPT